MMNAPLYMVAGAPGVGKTTLVPALVRLGKGIVVMDQDPSPADYGAIRDTDPTVHWILLDCDDQLRLSRLQEREWSQEWIDDAMQDAAQSREFIPTVITTDDENTEQIARRILAWVDALS